MRAKTRRLARHRRAAEAESRREDDLRKWADRLGYSVTELLSLLPMNARLRRELFGITEYLPEEE